VKTPLEPSCLQVQVLPDAAHKQVDASAIKVETLNGTVMLSGFCPQPRGAAGRRTPGRERERREERAKRDRRAPLIDDAVAPASGGAPGHRPHAPRGGPCAQHHGRTVQP